jgi:hypothetical protein
MSLKAAKSEIAATRQSPYNTYAPVPVPAWLAIRRERQSRGLTGVFFMLFAQGPILDLAFGSGEKHNVPAIYSRRG